MELSGQIKKYRGEKGWNQRPLQKSLRQPSDSLNWETKSYP